MADAVDVDDVETIHRANGRIHRVHQVGDVGVVVVLPDDRDVGVDERVPLRQPQVGPAQPAHVRERVLVARPDRRVLVQLRAGVLARVGPEDRGDFLTLDVAHR